MDEGNAFSGYSHAVNRSAEVYDLLNIGGRETLKLEIMN